ncbi:MAG: phenylacetic acid degradation bifunctional protein PaaZ [Saprospiraceae bacterium]|uniref:Phenylacetic acid degradation bifunctional protein PaaZ n=1 Tax=Candidatus Defluviibacterium haderslevense TaxID=2981993 RepID=A0A9D7S807_9BACT|nr:phenylacetic acid degradation bifunctional protein PaaZ [Candidatus Defluviibacterium haderslevense]MBL0238840.1 phenylacetic acid degradation bifunctional protein PaaZ [Candidatus Defluviibacterium haderslevense]MCC7027140.1 phenylacetic acid degradation bifunctional protein PaaZ [Saprospiraceae bacterium]
MLLKLKNYIEDQWIEGNNDGQILMDSVKGEPIAIASSSGIDFEKMLQYGRKVGGNNLRKLTFHERGRMLKALALFLTERKSLYYPISYMTGATKTDSWVDIDGGIGTLFAYASLRKKFPNQKFYVDGDPVSLSKSNTFIGHHIMVPKEGVAIHINAFNFPIWGMLEKISVNLLAGVPAIIKPATVTSFLTEAVFKDIISSGILPKGSIQLICGSANGILDHVISQDVVTFTGSSQTGRQLKAHPKIISESVPFNMEADSLNCSILGLDAAPGSKDFDIFIKEVHREITTKCGQKCTAIRRIIVPQNYLSDVQIALSLRLQKTIIGNPNNEEVKMGALAGPIQLKEVKEKIIALSKLTPIVYGTLDPISVVDADGSKGSFISPILMLNEQPFKYLDSHELEAFGPVSTLIPYNDLDEAIAISKLGKGSLVSSIITSDKTIATSYVLNAASHHGRILILNESCAKESTGHGSPMPMLVHGGPGRAGGGEEMGGLRGVKHYLQRTAIQGSPDMISQITQVHQYGSTGNEKEIHLFKKYFEELNIGDMLVTAKHTVTDADITNFANLSGDHFYAHMDATSLEGTIFNQRVAHGYYILSKAAGLFVDAKKGPVLLNYGIDECRFTKPVYPGMTICVKLIVKEKIEQEKKSEDDIDKGIVKWLVDVFDESGDSVAIATILTMVKKKYPSI